MLSSKEFYMFDTPSPLEALAAFAIAFIAGICIALVWAICWQVRGRSLTGNRSASLGGR